MTLRALLAVTSLGFLCACTLGPNFKVPRGPKVGSYLASADQPLPAGQRLELTTAIAGSWWTTFHNPQLDRLIKTALAGNQDIAAARARLAEAGEAVNVAHGAQLPQLSLGATAGRQKYGVALFGPANFSIPPFTYYSVGPAVSFPLDLFGDARRRLEQQQALQQYRAFQLDAADLSVAAEISAEALTLASATAQIDTLNAVIAADRRDVKLVKEALHAGSATRTQLLTVQSQLASDRTLLPALHQAQSAARHALAILAGTTPSNFSAPDFRLNQFTRPRTLRLSVPSALVHQRPDILAAEAQLHAASAAIGVATANLYPHIDLTANLQQEALTPGGLFNSVAAAWSMAANLSLPLFDGGQLHAKRRAAVDAYKAALARYRQTILKAFGQVSDRLEALVNDGDEVRAQTAATQTATASRDLARRSFEVGYTGILNVVDAERQAARAQLGLTRATAKRLMDTAALYAALGAPGLSDAPPTCGRSGRAVSAGAGDTAEAARRSTARPLSSRNHRRQHSVRASGASIRCQHPVMVPRAGPRPSG